VTFWNFPLPDFMSPPLKYNADTIFITATAASQNSCLYRVGLFLNADSTSFKTSPILIQGGVWCVALCCDGGSLTRRLAKTWDKRRSYLLLCSAGSLDAADDAHRSPPGDHFWLSSARPSRIGRKTPSVCCSGPQCESNLADWCQITQVQLQQ